MRKNIYWLLLVGLIAASCGSSSKDQKGSLNDKKTELQKLKDEQKDINDKIASKEAEIAKLDTGAAKSANAKLVSITPLATQNFVHYIDLQGKIDAENVSYVSPRLGPGLVKAVYVTKGQQVRKGQLLLKLDDAVQRQNITAAKQGLETVRSQLSLARDLYSRQNNLWKQGIGTEVQLLSAKTNVQTLESQLNAAQANIRTLQEQANATNVYAEVSGIADEVNIRPGETFTGFSGTMPQIRIVNTSSLKTMVQVPENYAGKVKLGAPVVVVLPDINRTFTDVKISRAGQLIDPNNRTFTAEARIPYDPAIRPNQIAQIRIQDYAVQNTIAIPVNTIQSDEKSKYVFIAVKEGDKMVARKRAVNVGELNGSLIEVKSGLNAGDQLITEGYQNLYEGQVITITAK
jgi:membrane fusion protein (multidrug efflux system)